MAIEKAPEGYGITGKKRDPLNGIQVHRWVKMDVLFQ